MHSPIRFPLERTNRSASRDAGAYAIRVFPTSGGLPCVGEVPNVQMSTEPDRLHGIVWREASVRLGIACVGGSVGPPVGPQTPSALVGQSFAPTRANPGSWIGWGAGTNQINLSNNTPKDKKAEPGLADRGGEHHLRAAAGSHSLRGSGARCVSRDSRRRRSPVPPMITRGRPGGGFGRRSAPSSW